MLVVDYAALSISVSALLFTVGSFWWMQARRGALRAFEAETWAAVVDRKESRLRLPLALHNTGAAAVVVLALRIRFAASGEVLDWTWTWQQLKPDADGLVDAASPFAIPGREVRELVPEFLGSLPGTVPEQRVYPVLVEARTSHRDQRETILAFDLQFTNLVHPGNYIVYSNRPDYLDDASLAEGAERLHQMRVAYDLVSGSQPSQGEAPERT